MFLEFEVVVGEYLHALVIVALDFHVGVGQEDAVAVAGVGDRARHEEVGQLDLEQHLVII